MKSTVTKTVAAMVAEAKARIENLPPARVAEEIQGTDVLLVDIREAHERAKDGVIKAQCTRLAACSSSTRTHRARTTGPSSSRTADHPALRMTRRARLSREVA